MCARARNFARADESGGPLQVLSRKKLQNRNRQYFSYSSKSSNEQISIKETIFLFLNLIMSDLRNKFCAESKIHDTGGQKMSYVGKFVSMISFLNQNFTVLRLCLPNFWIFRRPGLE